MPNVTFKFPDDREEVLDVPLGSSLMQAAVDANIKEIVAECGGNAACGTCHVYVQPHHQELPPIKEDEDEMLSFTACERTDQSRLSCQIAMTEALAGLTVRLPDAQI